jgi:hypothetical protein
VLKVKTHLKAGGVTLNHNETLVRTLHPAAGLKVKTRIKAGGLSNNHNETLVQAPRRRACGSRHASRPGIRPVLPGPN